MLCLYTKHFSLKVQHLLKTERRAEWKVAVMVNEEPIGTKDKSDKVLVMKILWHLKLILAFIIVY